jgi:hypothetical protein
VNVKSVNQVSTSYNVILVAILVTVVAGIVGVIAKPESTVPVLGFCGLICTSLFALLKADTTATKVEEVKMKLETTDSDTKEKLDVIKVVADKTHDLVNGAMSAQLKISAVALRRVADLSKHESDTTAADLAERALSEHELKQQMVAAYNQAAKVEDVQIFDKGE